MPNLSHIDKKREPACEGDSLEKLVLIAVAVLLATAGVAWLVMVWE